MFLAALFCFIQFHVCSADLRMAAQTKARGRRMPPFRIREESRRRLVPFQAGYALYMEPSDFGYEGLKKQRDKNYDNFLRSNIDNEQDNRDFNREDGRDHLPFRSFEASPTDDHESQKHKIPKYFPGNAIRAVPGEPVLVPLRWNNPHSSELEVNVWIVKNKYVVPIRRPACSGEGYQDNAITFTVPEDFNDLGKKVPGFDGCDKVGDCVLQIYAHSVESRTYAIGTPLIVEGRYGSKASASDESQIQAAGVDPGLDLQKLRVLCLPSNDPSVDITSSVPRHARLVSDQYNHAYQNSDYSPYSGQQPDDISQNMQASVIIKMIPGNRGELGKRALQQDNRQGFLAQKRLNAKAKKLYKTYEQLANKLINQIGAKMIEEESSMGPAINHEGEEVSQKTHACFRCATVGSTVQKRLTTTTYIPSFQIPQDLLSSVRNRAEYSKIMSDSGLVQIYVTTINDLQEDFKQAAALNIKYMPPMIKTTLGTKRDKTKFKKIDANGKNDNGIYAAREAYKANGVAPWGTPGALIEIDDAVDTDSDTEAEEEEKEGEEEEEEHGDCGGDEEADADEEEEFNAEEEHDGRQSIFAQCGGKYWTGATECQHDNTCTFKDESFSQCLPSSSFLQQSESVRASEPDMAAASCRALEKEGMMVSACGDVEW